jgi:hypothetical protein
MLNVECAKILLDHGADTTCISSNGRSTLAQAVVHSNHAVLRLFIDRCDTSPERSVWQRQRRADVEGRSIDIVGFVALTGSQRCSPAKVGPITKDVPQNQN